MTERKKVWGTAGCGKTTFLLSEIDRLKKEKKLNLSDFCVVTYRKTMADELKDKLQVNKKKFPYISTIHSVCFKLLRENVSEVELINEEHKEKFCSLNRIKYYPDSTIYDECEITPMHKLEYHEQVIRIASKMKNIRYDLNNVEKFAVVEYGADIFHGLMPTVLLQNTIFAWEKFKHEEKIVDFTDMIAMVIEHKLVPPVSVLIVDEFQDVSPLQNKLIEMWSKEIGFVVVAGDPLQSIYGFHGSSPTYFEEFDGDLVVLNRTYRLPETIWHFAKGILRNQKYLIPEITCEKKGGLVDFIYWSDLKKHFEFSPENKTYHLVRANYIGKCIGEVFISEGIPFKSSKRSFGGWSGKDTSIFNLIIKLRKLFSKKECEFNGFDILLLKDLFKSKVFVKKKVEIIADVEAGISDTSQYVLDLFKPFFEGYQEFERILFSPNPFFYTLKSQMNDQLEFKLKNTLLRTNKEILDIKLHLETIHGSKGGQAHTVYLYDAITTKVKKGMMYDKGKEEAKVWFVGVTRAEQELFIVKGFCSDSFKFW